MNARRPLPPLNSSLRKRLSGACERLGLHTVARVAGVTPVTLAASLAGASVMPATARVLALAADEIEHADACVDPS